MQITMNKKYTYRNGESARILCVDRPDADIPVISMRENGAVVFHRLCGKQYSNVSEWDLIEEWTPQDKEPVWVWDNGYTCYRALRFFDVNNNRCFRMDGSRNGPDFLYYAKVEHLEQWILDAQALLKD